MKNTFNFNLGEINVTIEGTPVQITEFHLEFTNEASVQELATSASFIKDLIGEIKSTIKEAQTSAQYTPTSTTTTAAKTTTENKIEPKMKQRWDLPAVWSVMMAELPKGFEKAGVGCYTYKKDEAIIRTSFKDEYIGMNIRSGDAQASFYLYEDADRSWFNGINQTLINELIDELPEGVGGFVGTFVKKVLNK